MVLAPRKLFRKAERSVCLTRAMLRVSLLAAVVLGLVQRAPLHAQMSLPQTDHYRHHVADEPPGAIGRQQLTRGGPLRGYFQPVEIRAPAGTRVAVAVGGQFEPPQETPLTVGMLIGQVYRLRVTQIPAYEGLEVFPTIEVINRLYPPEGKKWRFPVPVELTRKELVFALKSKFVTRVIYLEDPERALPLQELPGGFQRYFEVARDEDPLKVADRLGRPMAILRMGSRTPPVSGPDASFLFDCPPLVPAPQFVTPTPADQNLEEITPRTIDESLPGPQAWMRNLPDALVSGEATGP